MSTIEVFEHVARNVTVVTNSLYDGYHLSH